MLRWYLNASKLTASNQSLADQDLSGPLLILSVQFRVNFDDIRPFTNELLVVVVLIFSLQIQASWANFIFLYSSFECRFLVLVTHIDFLVVSLRLLYYYWIEKVVPTTLWSLKRDCFKACCGECESWRSKFMKLVEYFLLTYILFKQFYTYNEWNLFILVIMELTTLRTNIGVVGRGLWIGDYRSLLGWSVKMESLPIWSEKFEGDLIESLRQRFS